MGRRETDEWRVVNRRMVLIGRTLQLGVMRNGEFIGVGPIGGTLEELRADVEAMLAALTKPVLVENGETGKYEETEQCS